jgi:outer membrane receptor protein involved in Fe transport
MKSLKLALCSATALAGLAAPSAALAQTAPTAPAAEETEIVVTGSRIRRDATNAPTPLIQIRREEVLQSGEANVIDFLADLPALSDSLVPEDTTGGGLGVGGLSLLDLRGLGEARTLTLVDGRRHVGSAYFASNAVDIDSIPRLLIEDIEVITGGASAVYGADAVTGVVNFIQRKRVEGLEIDAAVGEINQEGQLNKRISALWGANAFERFNFYLSGEFEQSDAVTEADIDWLREGGLLIQNDLDPTNPSSDGNLDVIGVRGLGAISRPVGGVLTLARTPQPSALGDPDMPVVPCAATGFSANCFVLDPGFSFTFDPGGAFRPLDFGTFRAPAGQNRTNVIGSRDARRLVDQGSADRLPESETYRLQAGFNFDLTPNISLYGEAKYAEEQTLTTASAVFFNVGIRPFTATQATAVTGVNTFEIGLDNAYLPAALRDLITTNRRTTFGAPTLTAPGAATGTVADQRALFQNLLTDYGKRPQENTRESQRFVIGARGEADALAFVKNFAWDVGYTYGEVEDSNIELGAFDAERYAFAADAVVDTLGRVNGRPGEVVCRVRLLAAQGIAIPLGADITNARAVRRNYAANDPAITGCQPINIFGTSGIPESSRAYLSTFISRGFRIAQEDALAFASGEFWDFWGAGPIGAAIGAEYRKETFSGVIGGPPNRPDRVLFNNVYTITPERSYDVSEFFAELRVPILRDLPLAEAVEASGAFRTSNYSNTGPSETWSSQGSWRFSRDALLRGTYGKAIRSPTLNELFRGPAQTFVNITDTCSRPTIDATANPTTRANRNRNCAALGVPATYVDPNPTTTNAGVNGPNPNLNVEESTSWTTSLVLTPRFTPGFSFVADYYSIDIEEAIQSVPINTLLALCTDEAAVNAAACALIQRDPGTFEIVNFTQGFFNYAKLRTQGIDYTVNYGNTLENLIGVDAGRLDWSLKGSYLIRLQRFTDPLNPGIATNVDSILNYPRVRWQLASNYTVGKWGLNWTIDYQTSQEILDDDVLLNDPDNRDEKLLNSGDFATHDFSVRYDVNDRLRVRAGVVNAFDAEPPLAARDLNISNALAGLGGDADQFDVFGRRFFLGVTLRR